MKVHKLILNGTSDDGARLDDFCERLAGFVRDFRLHLLASSRSTRFQREPVSASSDSTG